MAATARSLSAEIEVEDRLRAEQYQLLAVLLVRPPDEALLGALRALSGDRTDLGRALDALGGAARSADLHAVEREYHDLFIGLGRGELVPYGSYYLTGFLNEKPLAKLRVDMSRLGIGRADEVKEPEDHIGALCEMMAGLILGWFRPPLDLIGQKAFFDAHLRPWAPRFFEDLEAAKHARLYRPVGTLGRVFVGIEETAFGMA
ncbi:MAG: molecular chaperone TorD family protein [Geminicoccaceae bacterium]|nr:molecular chaperone TorD family protein [Geminicoccaceae bacterium]